MRKDLSPLTPKQVRFVREYVKTGNAMQSAITVGYTQSYATQISARLNAGKLEKVRKAIDEICDEQGLTDEYLLGLLKADIDAKPKDRKGELELAFRVKGRIKKDNDGGGNTFNTIILNGEQSERIARRIIASHKSGTAEPDRLHDSNESEVHT